MAKLRIKEVTLPSYKDVKFLAKEKVLPDKFWLWTGTYTVFANALLMNEKCENLETDEYAEVIPALNLLNLYDTDYKIGDSFEINGLTFIIVSLKRAICLTSIGEMQFDETPNIPERKDFCIVKKNKDASIFLMIKDWYDYYIKGKDVIKATTPFIKSLRETYEIKTLSDGRTVVECHPLWTDIYLIVKAFGYYTSVEGKPNHKYPDGRYIILNKLEQVVYDAYGYGFKSEEAAKKYLLYQIKNGIPKKDFDAYEYFMADDLPF